MSEPKIEELQDLQRAHLEFLESYFSDITVEEVPILQCINYRTIQVVNNIGLKAILRVEGDDGGNE